MRNRKGTIVGLTCRVGRAVTGHIDMIRDLLDGNVFCPALLSLLPCHMTTLYDSATDWIEMIVEDGVWCIHVCNVVTFYKCSGNHQQAASYVYTPYFLIQSNEYHWTCSLNIGVTHWLCARAVPNSVLFLGRPGVGKTTVVREMARVLADDLHKRVVIVDTSNEIGGDGDVRPCTPPPCARCTVHILAFIVQ